MENPHELILSKIGTRETLSTTSQYVTPPFSSSTLTASLHFASPVGAFLINFICMLRLGPFVWYLLHGTVDWTFGLESWFGYAVCKIGLQNRLGKLIWNCGVGNLAWIVGLEL